LAAWLAAFAYSIQIYFDFSGYSDMAIGLGLLLGFRFPENFRSPYLARSMGEVWQRWHISLSTWLRDYLYLPLGGNRCSKVRAEFNVAVTMMLGGLWHGAAWTYLLWGAWHGLILIAERRIARTNPYAFLPIAGQVFLTFMLWTLSLVIFKCESVGELGEMINGMLGLNGLGSVPDLGIHQPVALGALVIGCLVVFCVPRSQQLVRRCHPLVMLGTMFLFALAVCQVLSADYIPFIYYRF
jgi:alginate O-acetyltransferase complex protein AlgI